MSSSKSFKDSDTSAYERWELPNIAKEKNLSSTKDDSVDPITAADIEKVHQQAYDDGFTKGHQEGVEKGLADAKLAIENKLSQLDQVLNYMTAPLDDIDEEVIQQTAELAMAVARHLVRREIKTDPGQVIAVVKEAIATLPVSSRNIKVFLHPEDAILVKESLSVNDVTDDSATWQIYEEPLLSRGGCKVTADNSSIDATVEKRLNRVIASVLGGERTNDNTD